MTSPIQNNPYVVSQTIGDIYATGGLSEKNQQLLAASGLDKDTIADYDVALKNMTLKLDAISQTSASPEAKQTNATIVQNIQPPDRTESPYFDPSIMYEVRKLMVTLLVLSQQIGEDVLPYNQDKEHQFKQLVSMQQRAHIENIQDIKAGEEAQKFNAATATLEQAVERALSNGIALGQAMLGIGNAQNTKASQSAELAQFFAQLMPQSVQQMQASKVELFQQAEQMLAPLPERNLGSASLVGFKESLIAASPGQRLAEAELIEQGASEVRAGAHQSLNSVKVQMQDVMNSMAKILEAASNASKHPVNYEAHASHTN